MPDPGRVYRLGDSDELEGDVETLRLCSEQLGSCHPETLMAAQSLAVALWHAGYTDHALGLLDQALDFSASSLEDEHPLRVDLLNTLGESCSNNAMWSKRRRFNAKCWTIVFGIRVQSEPGPARAKAPK